MARSFSRILGLTTAALVVSPMLFAAEWKCTNASGCPATNPNGQQVVLADGDIVATEAGWVVDRDNGWVPV